jgi:hypothetical protein
LVDRWLDAGVGGRHWYTNGGWAKHGSTIVHGMDGDARVMPGSVENAEVMCGTSEKDGVVPSPVEDI